LIVISQNLLVAYIYIKTELVILWVLVLGIRRIRKFLGLQDPDPLVRGMDPDPDPDLSFSS
jgi:hypothetical protein